MASASTNAPGANRHEIVISRELGAPREAVWRAWTERDAAEAWWGPEQFSARVEALDVRPGGHWRFVMIGPDGAEYPSEGVFREVERPERLVTTDEFGDDFEAPAGMELPQGIVVTTLLEALGAARTRLTIRIAHPSEEDRRKHEDMGVVAGWSSSLDSLERYLAGV